MFLLIKKIIKIFFINKDFSIPKNIQIIIFDGEGKSEDRLSESCNNYKRFILETRDYRVKKIYINFKIIPKIILKIRKNIEVSSIDIYLFKYFFLI